MATLQMAMFAPKSEWVPPAELPDIFDAKKIAIDVETRDPDLKSRGPGWPTGNGEVVGYAVATEDWSGYLPINHLGGGNLDARLANKWLKKVFECPADKIMHNAQYDAGWIKQMGFDLNGRIIDTMLIASLLDENRFSYSLNALAYDYLNKTKSEKGLTEAAREFGLDPKAEMWKMPAQFVGPYAEVDAELTLELWSHFSAELGKQELWPIANLELDLLPCLVDMTFRGVRVDLDRAEKTRVSILKKEKEVLGEIKKLVGNDVEIWAAQSLAKAFDKVGVPYPQTEKGAPSFTKAFLLDHPHKLPGLITQARNLNKTSGTFITNMLTHCHKDGRIHSHINQVRSDDGGTVSGRMCLHGDTVLELDIGPVKIGSYEPTGKEKIKTHTGEWKRVVRRYFKGVEDMVRVTIATGDSVTCTRGHRVLSSRGWLPAGELHAGDEVYHVSEQNAVEGRSAVQKSRTSLRGGGQTHHRDSRFAVSDFRAHRASYGEGGSFSGGAESGAYSSAIAIKDGRSEPYDGKIRGSSPQLQRRSFRREGLCVGVKTNLVYGETGQQTRFPTSDCPVRSFGSDGTARRLSDSPHRRGPLEQPIRQLGDGHLAGPQAFAQSIPVAKIEPVGKACVWDIEVEDDHSFVAQGMIHHNSYHSPNMQQIPSRDPEIGPLIRSLFLPEEDQQWASIDYSQQEPRILVHYASVFGKSRGAELAGAAEFVEAYNSDPETDFHSLVAEMAGISRKQAKVVNLAMMYGMGVAKLSEQLDIPEDEAKSLIRQYHDRVPFVKGLQKGVINRLDSKSSSGSIRSLLGRKCRFDKWEPDTFAMNKALTYREAVQEYGEHTRLKRAFTYKSLNRLIQASAADQTKKAMVDIYKTGRVPMIQIHDEIAMSVTGMEEAKEIAKIMIDAVPLCVPSKCDIEIGDSWGEAK